MVTDDMPQLNAEATEVNDDCLSVTDDSRSFNDEVQRRFVEAQNVMREALSFSGEVRHFSDEFWNSSMKYQNLIDAVHRGNCEDQKPVPITSTFDENARGFFQQIGIAMNVFDDRLGQ